MENSSQTDMLVLKEGTSSKNYALMSDEERLQLAQKIAEKVRKNATEKGIPVHFSDGNHMHTLQPATAPSL